MGIRSRVKARIQKAMGRAPASTSPKAQPPRPPERMKPASPAAPPAPHTPSPKPTAEAAKPSAQPTPRTTAAKEGPTPEQLAKQRKALLRAKRGTLRFVDEAGGTAGLAEMHDHSERRFFVGHRSFSRLMEEMTEERLLDYDHGSGVATLTDAGRQWLAEQERGG